MPPPDRTLEPESSLSVTSPRTTGSEEFARGTVIMADGIGGWDVGARWLGQVLRRSELPVTYHRFYWSHGRGRWLADLSRWSHVQQRAEELAERVEASRRDDPESRIVLIGKSGGTAIVVGALERLPADSVEAAILIASALSPDYDLGPALDAVSDRMVVMSSPMDLIFLGAGTLIFGTIDRHHRPGAGLVGFRTTPSVQDDPRRRAKLSTWRWRPQMLGHGHWGGHMAQDTPWFYRHDVLPILREVLRRRPSPEIPALDPIANPDQD